MTESTNSPFDRLQQQSRCVELRRAAQLTDEQRGELTEQIKSFCQRCEISQAELAKMAGTSASVVSQVLAGTYSGRIKTILERLASVIEAEKARRANCVSRRFVETRVARDIFTVAKTAMKSGRICVAVGRAGIGKSMTLRAIVARFPQTLLIEINDGCNTPSGLYQQLSDMVARRQAARSKVGAFRQLVESLKDSNRLILFDEGENLTNAGLNGVRQLHDATGCPMLLAGRPPLLKKIARTRDDDRIGGGLMGRILMKRAVDLRDADSDGGPCDPLFDEAEILQMISRWEVRIAPSASRWLSAVANLVMLDDGREGCGLRYALSVFELAVKVNPEVARDRGKQITLEMLKEVNAELLDEEYVRQIDSDLGTLSRQLRKSG